MCVLSYICSYRVLPDLSVSNLRKEILIQLEGENIPNSFVFVRGVGRHFTEVSPCFYSYRLQLLLKR